MDYIEFDDIKLYNENSLDLYDKWETPDVIISDGAYGINGFPTDPNDISDLKEWYEPHVLSWSLNASSETTLWFWNTELGWATIHPLLEKHNWEYRGTNIWNKGIQHVAGNVNSKTIRKFPQVTEVCVQYVKKPTFNHNRKQRTVKDWLISEWKRTGLTKKEANKACGVSSAASRKYLTKGSEWYFPPKDKFKKLVEYANKHGNEQGSPYFEITRKIPITDDYELKKPKFNCPIGTTNVWSESQLNSKERMKKEDGKSIHLNQKPKSLMRKIIKASSNKNDIVWEPFGGLGTASIVSKEEDRIARYAEIEEKYYNLTISRIKNNFSYHLQS